MILCMVRDLWRNILGCQRRLFDFFLGSSSGVENYFFEFVLGSTGDLLGWFLCNRLSFWRGSQTVLGTSFPAEFLSSETAGTGRKPAETARNRPKPAIHEV